MSNKPGMRQFLRVANFDEMQNPKRPKRPTWIKTYVRDLDDPDRLKLSLAVRGFLSEFEKLAASMMNRVPDDIPFIARKINTQPAVAGKALNTCLTHGFIVRFAEDMNTSRNNDLYQKTDTRPIPPSNSNSQSKSSSQEDSSTSVQRASSASRDGEEHWQAIDDLDIPF